MFKKPSLCLSFSLPSQTARIILVSSFCLHTTIRQFYVCVCVSVRERMSNQCKSAVTAAKNPERTCRSPTHRIRHTQRQPPRRCAERCDLCSRCGLRMSQSFIPSLMLKKKNFVQVEKKSHTHSKGNGNGVRGKGKLRTHPHGELNQSPTLYQRLQLRC